MARSGSRRLPPTRDPRRRSLRNITQLRPWGPTSVGIRVTVASCAGNTGRKLGGRLDTIGAGFTPSWTPARVAQEYLRPLIVGGHDMTLEQPGVRLLA